MSSDDTQTNDSWPLEEQAFSNQERSLTHGMSPLFPVTSVIEQRRTGLPPAGRGQPPRSYAITPAGRERFLSLLLTPGASSRDTPEEFVIKLTKFQLLTPAQRVTVLQWYRSYQGSLCSAYQEARDSVRHHVERS